MKPEARTLTGPDHLRENGGRKKVGETLFFRFFCKSPQSWGLRRGRLPRAVRLVVVGRGLAERTRGLAHQIRLDEPVDVSLEHAVDVAHLLLRPMVLDQLIRVEDVAANLVAEGDVLLLAAELIELRLLLLHPQVVEP